MKTIKINIPDNLSAEKEVFAIAKKLQQKALSGTGKNKEVLQIGDNIDIKDLETQIIITRVSTEKPIEMVKCNVCDCEYQNNMAFYYFHNYGGSRKRNAVCSDKCRQFMIDNFGVRIAKSASKLPNPINYFRDKS